MDYITRQALIDRFGETELIELTDRSGSGAIDDAVLDRAVNDATAEINSYLEARYTLPLSAVPQVIKTLAANIARYYLFDDRATEVVEARYTNAVKFLRALGKGEVSLGLDDAGDATSPAGGPDFEAPDAVFSGDAKTLDDF